MKSGRRWSIQARVLCLVVFFTLLTAGTVLTGSVRTFSARLRRSTLQSAEYAVQTAAENILQDILEVDALPNWCALNYAARTAMFTDLSAGTLAHSSYPIISTRYASMRNSLYLQRFLIRTAYGKIIMLGAASTRSKPVTAENAALFPGLADGAELPPWSCIAADPLMQPGAAVQGIPIARRITSGSAEAWVYLSVSPALITDALKQIAPEDGGWLCWIMGGQLYRMQGDELVCMGDAGLLAQTEDGGITLDAATRLYTARLDGVDCSVVARPLGVHGLHLGEVIPNSSLVCPMRMLVRPGLASLAVILASGLVIAALLHHTVAGPIKALQKRIEAVSGGDFTADPSIEWDHELGDVGRGINRLSQDVSDLMARRLEDEKQRLDLEYRMLQNQTNPHFIYNTLNSIKWMATLQHASGVAEMVTALSRLMKSVSKGNQKLVPLEEEFALLEDYFTIQRYRYGGTITLDIRPPEDETLVKTYLIPRFTLQPLAENAIFHGIEPKGGVGRLVVEVFPAPAGEGVSVRMSDDGVGMEAEHIARILAGPQGDGEDAPRYRHVGVWNVHRLLQLSFGAEYGLQIESEPGRGTTITIRLPGCRKAARAVVGGKAANDASRGEAE